MASEKRSARALTLHSDAKSPAFLPSIFKRGKVYRFRNSELMFLDALIKCEGDIAKACGESGLGNLEAERFLRRAKTREVMAERARETALMRGATCEWWWAKVVEGIEGGKAFGKSQVELLKEAGARLVPKVERVQHSFDDGVEFAFMARRSNAK